jgi:hypothetical protein
VRARTPEPGVPIVPSDTTDQRLKSEPGDGIPNARASSEPSGVSEPFEMLDPPVNRPVHFDEVTPPATEMDELQRMRERKQ